MRIFSVKGKFKKEIRYVHQFRALYKLDQTQKTQNKTTILQYLVLSLQKKSVRYQTLYAKLIVLCATVNTDDIFSFSQSRPLITVGFYSILLYFYIIIIVFFFIVYFILFLFFVFCCFFFCILSFTVITFYFFFGEFLFFWHLFSLKS